MYLKGIDLPDVIKLSDYMIDENDKLRVTGLRAGQHLEIDVTLNGQYKQPDYPRAAKWFGAAGREGVHTALLTIADSEGFMLSFAPGVEVKNSRGRGVTISNCHEFTANDIFVRGARTAGISCHNSSGFALNRPTTLDTGNYQDAKGEGPNWPGSIKFESCSDYALRRPISIDHLGNGITATQSKNGRWLDAVTIDVDGAAQYINASPDHGLINCVHIGRASAYVVNSEEEFQGISDPISIDECYALSDGSGVGFWGNEGQAGLVINDAAVTDCILISPDGIKIHQNANIADLDRTGTETFTEAEIDPGALTLLRLRGNQVANLVRTHAPNAEIDKAIDTLKDEFESLRPLQLILDAPVETEATYSKGQQLVIIAHVDDADKATLRVVENGSVGGFTIRKVFIDAPEPTEALFQEIGILAAKLRQIAEIAG